MVDSLCKCRWILALLNNTHFFAWFVLLAAWVHPCLYSCLVWFSCKFLLLTLQAALHYVELAQDVGH